MSRATRWISRTPPDVGRRHARSDGGQRQAKQHGDRDGEGDAFLCSTHLLIETNTVSIQPNSIHPTSRPVAYMIAEPREQADRDGRGRKVRVMTELGSRPSGAQSGESPGRWRLRRARDRERRRPANTRGRPSHAPAIVGTPPIAPRRASVKHARPLLGNRRDDRKPFGRVVQREPDDEQRAERRLSERERGADREPFAEDCADRYRPRRAARARRPGEAASRAWARAALAARRPTRSSASHAPAAAAMNSARP